MNKKKIIALVIPIFMITVSFIVLFNGNPNANFTNNVISYSIPSSFSTYSIPIDVKNYTLPYYDYNISSDYYGSNSIITKYSPTHTLTAYYYGSNGELDEYIFSSGDFKVLSSFSTPEKTNGQILYPVQLTNNSVNGVGAVSNNAGDIEFEYYNFYTNILKEFNTSFNTTIALHQSSMAFNDNYFYLSNATNGNELYNKWINMTNDKYYYLNITITGWNSVSYFNYGNSWIMEDNDLSTLENTNYIMNFSSSSNSFVEHTIYSNALSGMNNGDYNNQPFYQVLLSNGTVLISGYSMGTSSTYYTNNLYYHNGIYKNVISNFQSEMGDSDGNAFIFNNKIQYYIEGENDNTGSLVNQNAFVNINNNTILTTNNTWFNNYLTTKLIGYMSTYGNGLSINYFGYSGWENTLENQSNGNIMVYYNPNRVNEFTPSNISFEQNRYNLEIKENGLPLSTQWTYTFNGTSYTLTNNSYNYSLINGNYALSVSSVNGYNVAYPSTITIDNASKIAYVNFSAIPKYVVHIKENGLPLGTSWNFTIKHDSSIIVAETLSTNEFNTSLQNGTYYLYAGSESGYNLNIHTSPFTVSGSAITEYVNYSAIPTYTLYLKESGLSSSTKWIAYVNSVEYSSTNEYINVSGLNNGTYSLSIDNVADYSLGSYPSSFTISGNNYYVNITFTHNISLYSAKFIANHVKDINSIVWSIVFNGTTYSSQNSNTIIVPSLKNGTYSLSVNNIAGYITDKYDSSVVINGVNITETINFNETFTLVINPVNYTGSFTFNLNGTSYTVSGSHSITVINGTYSFTVSSIFGYSLSYNSPIIINGANYEENITFIKIANRVGYYTVEFIIIGMNQHTSWSVVINGEQYYSNTYELNISLKNGTYYPDINVPDNYILSNNGVLIVNGNNTVYYSSASQTTFGSFVQYMPYFVIFVLIIGLMAIVIAVKRR